MERLIARDRAGRGNAVPPIAPRPKSKPREPGHRNAIIGPFCEPDELDYLLLFVCLFHIYVCPYTKVEESFNMQAMHDLLYHGTNTSAYDHLEFPGVVPRTFLGAMATSLLVAPLSAFFQVLQAPKFISMNLSRGALALISVSCTSAFRWQLGRRFGGAVSVAYACVTIVQFHLNFYSSRALPNTFALALVHMGYSYLVKDDYRACMCVLAVTSAVFRFEIVLLATPILAMAISEGKLSFGKAVVCGAWGILAGVVGGAVSVGVDSALWGRFVWPEFEGFYFNAVLNKSHEWGTSPVHWYITSAIPRCMLGTLLFIPSSLVLSPRMRKFIIPAFIYLATFSMLPHKELRFVLYAIPILNTVAAEELARIWTTRETAKYGKLILRASTTVMAFSMVSRVSSCR